LSFAAIVFCSTARFLKREEVQKGLKFLGRNPVNSPKELWLIDLVALELIQQSLDTVCHPAEPPWSRVFD
jgi:hypothetical protein